MTAYQNLSYSYDNQHSCNLRRSPKSESTDMVWHLAPGWDSWIWITTWGPSHCYIMIALFFEVHFVAKELAKCTHLRGSHLKIWILKIKQAIQDVYVCCHHCLYRKLQNATESKNASRHQTRLPHLSTISIHTTILQIHFIKLICSPEESNHYTNQYAYLLK